MKPILDFTFTEMLNNAIDHSGGTAATVRWFLDPQRLSFEIEDDGIGAFRRVHETAVLMTTLRQSGKSPRANKQPRQIGTAD